MKEDWKEMNVKEKLIALRAGVSSVMAGLKGQHEALSKLEKRVEELEDPGARLPKSGLIDKNGEYL